ncbi:putative disease resistance protein At4g11170 [Brassica rapa]|uniref:putative disease resistance protein At4g11170 n=1 Tax=Brassica campestris TaxID=3711 RepID=UPI0004F171C3|nr:putative disease resistance protein At4g11170 [Brassica rapa]
MEISFLHLTIFVFLAFLSVPLRRFREFLKKPETPQLRTHVPSSVSSAAADESRGPSLWKYDVFLSFRGTDSRRSFVSHLYEALTKEGIKAFHDDRELTRGGFIWKELVKAIEESRFAVVVLTEGYATSRWCLEELSLIVDLASKKRLELIPVFLDIDPSELKRRNGWFEKALAKHELRYDLETVGRWRKALAEVGNISGWDSKTRSEEAVLVQEVVRDLSNRLFSQPSSDAEGLVGIMPHLRSVESLLSMDSGDVRMVGIWGMGGIGKSTIAKFVCKRLSSKFDGVCFLENAKTEFEQYGSSHMRQKVLREILRRKDLNSWDGDSGVMRQRLRGKSILLVIDNVDSVEQLQELVGSLEWFGPGSRIVITTRDKRVLEQHDVEYIYEVKPLKTTQALMLFSKHAFKQPRPPKDSAELSIDIVKQLDGLPLAIRVAGAALYRRDIADWEYYLDLLRTNVNSSVSKALRESFEALNNQEKLIFLYVACCFNGKHMHGVSRVLDLFIVSGHMPFRSTLCIRTLKEKCLISISTTQRLWVHDVLQDMARSIICEGKEENPWKRKILWNFMDINNVLCENMGSEAVEVESLLLDMPKGKELCISPAIFERMYNLKLLKFYNNSTGGESSKICMPGGLVYLPMLRYLHWQAYSLKSLPSRFCTTYLVELNLPNSSVETLWNGTQDLGNLRRMNLRGCRRLLEVPNLSKATSLEKLNLDNCESLVDLTDSVRHLNNLGVLELSGCKKLKNLPNNINLRLLRTLHLEGCSSLEDFPFLSENVRKITLDETAIEEIPASIERLSELKTLHLSGCKKLKNLPRTIRNIDSLTTLWLSNCPNITLFPEVGDNIESLALKGTAIEEVPATIGDKSRLCYLNMSGCQRLKNLPPTLKNLTNLKFLLLRGCTNITERPETACRLKALDLNGTSIMEETSGSVQSDDEPLDMPRLAQYILQSVKERIRHQRSMRL